MQAKMQYQLDHLHDHLHPHHDGVAGDAKSGEASSSWADGLKDITAKMQYEMEHLHDHHHHHHHHDPFAQTASTSGTSESWTQGLMNLQADMQHDMQHLHDHDHDRHHQESRAGSKLRGSRREAAATPVQQPSAKADSNAALSWAPVKAWKERAPKRGAQAATLGRESLQKSATWSGGAPNVSCIMALPATTTAQFHLMYA